MELFPMIWIGICLVIIAITAIVAMYHFANFISGGKFRFRSKATVVICYISLGVFGYLLYLNSYPIYVGNLINLL